MANVTLTARTQRTIPGGVTGPATCTITVAATATSPVYAFITPTGRWMKARPSLPFTLTLDAGESVSGVFGFENQTITVTVA